MKILDILSVRIALNNEEKEFVKSHGKEVFLSSLDRHANWIAQNLVRKGIYEISNDNRQLVKVRNVFNYRSNIQET